MSFAVDVSDSSLKFRALRFVNKGYIPEHIDECTLRAAVLRVPLRVLKILFWDIWVSLADESSALCAGILSFIAGGSLVGIVWVLYAIDPIVLAKVGLAIGLIVVGIVVILGFFALLAYLSDDQRGERIIWSIGDSAPVHAASKTAKFAWSTALRWPSYAVFYPVKWIFYDIIYCMILRNISESAYGGLVIVVILAAVVGLLVYFLVVATIITLIVLGGSALAIIAIALVCGFFEFGFFDYIKDRVCRPVNIV